MEQASAESQAEKFQQEFRDSMETWKNSALSGSSGISKAQAQAEEVVRKWGNFVNQLKTQSDVIMSNELTMENLGELITQNSSEKQTLLSLRNEENTRADQADSVNPKVRGSPYTNVLGLQRTFRDSTRTNILIVSVMFGLLALGSIGVMTAGFIRSSNNKSSGSASFVGVFPLPAV
jgi:hypothetical protein